MKVNAEKSYHSRNLSKPNTSYDYKTFFSFNATIETEKNILREVEKWLLEITNTDVSLTENFKRDLNESSLTFIKNKKRHETEYLIRLVNRNQNGTWRTNILATFNFKNESWISISVTSDTGQFVAAPRVAGRLFDLVEAHDSDLQLSSRPIKYSENVVDQLFDELCDPMRRGLVFVAGTSSEKNFDQFCNQVGEWTKHVLGMAQVIVLNPLATESFNLQLGDDYGVRPWTLRTYFPGVDPASKTDSMRHRFMSESSLQEDSYRIANRFGRIVRNYTQSLPAPEEVRSLTKRMIRLETNFFLDSLSQSVSSSEHNISPSETESTAIDTSGENQTLSDVSTEIANDASTYLAQINLVKSVLGISEISEESLKQLMSFTEAIAPNSELLEPLIQQIEEMNYELELLQIREENANKERDDLIIDNAILEDNNEKLSAENAWLYRRLAEVHDRPQYEYQNENTDPAPESFPELILKLKEFEQHGIFFTGDTRQIEDLVEYDDLNQALGMAWRALLLLRNYLTAKKNQEFTGNVDQFISGGPNQYQKFPPNRHAQNESKYVKGRKDFMQERKFLVPVDVAKNCEIEMVAHFKLAKLGGGIDPRMYYFDDSGKSGKIVIGYIGRHLTNRLT